MSWKDWPAYLKLGIILCSVYALLSIIYFVMFEFIIEIDTISLLEVLGIMSLPLGSLFNKLGESLMPFFLIINVVFYFLIGAIIGLIYQKIKKKKYKFEKVQVIKVLLVFALIFIFLSIVLYYYTTSLTHCQIGKNVSKPNCYKTLAIIKKDPSICENVEKLYLDWCYSEVFANQTTPTNAYPGF
jgi:hypothetical protein